MSKLVSQQKMFLSKAFLGAFVILLGLSFLFSPYVPTGKQEVHAQEAVVVIGGQGTIQDTISAGANTLLANIQNTLLIKEFTLDGIANAIMKQILKQITSSIVQWINSGFQGSPAFITDLGSFLTDIADKVAGDFIYGSELGFLCSPFQLNVRAALDLGHTSSFAQQSQCTLTGAMANVQNFAQGFSNWGSWLQMTSQPQNNQYGALMLARGELNARIANAQGQEVKLLEFGEGFLSMKQCTPVEGGGQKCNIVTPGKVIADQLNKSLGAGQDALIEADEINEIISALLAQLGQQAITGLNGLFGLSQGGYDSSGNQTPSYLDQLDNDESTLGYKDETQNPIQESIDAEEDYLALNEDIVSLIGSAERFLERLEDRSSGGSCNIRLSLSFERTRDRAEEDIDSSQNVLNKLRTLLVKYNASSDPNKRNDVYLEYADLQNEEKLHTKIDATNLEYEYEELDTELDKFINSASEKCRLRDDNNNDDEFDS